MGLEIADKKLQTSSKFTVHQTLIMAVCAYA